MSKPTDVYRDWLIGNGRAIDITGWRRWWHWRKIRKALKPEHFPFHLFVMGDDDA